MIEALVGNATVEKVLLYLANYGEGHISGIAQTFAVAKSQVRKQILRLENGGIVVGRDQGSLRVFSLNPTCAYRKELEVLLGKVLTLLPSEILEKHYRQRRRPRRTRKPL